MSNDIQRVFLLTTPFQEKAYFHPVRAAVLRRLAHEQQTISRTAAAFAVHPANLTHHFRILEKAGLIRLAERRDTGRNVEKWYRAVARSYIVSRDTVADVGQDTDDVPGPEDDVTASRVIAAASLQVAVGDLSRLGRECESLAARWQKKDPRNGNNVTVNLVLSRLP
ncbi:MAG TPA: ArsR family transcriptional regulator [Spirochaetia bacterium]|nr:ArsR family transcriptional regulator [Spirochaetia bacterium]